MSVVGHVPIRQSEALVLSAQITECTLELVEPVRVPIKVERRQMDIEVAPFSHFVVSLEELDQHPVAVQLLEPVDIEHLLGVGQRVPWFADSRRRGTYWRRRDVAWFPSDERSTKHSDLAIVHQETNSQ